MTKLILTRHGHVDGIEPERFRGRTDLPLTELGRAQAKAVSMRVAMLWSPVAIYTSPMTRCVETGGAIAKACRVEAHVLEDLNDLDYGQWQWLTYDEVSRVWPDQFATWKSVPHMIRFPGGDSLQDLVARTGNALNFAVWRHRFETVVFVGHDSVNRALLLQLLDQPLSAYWRLTQAPCGLNEIDIIDNIIRIHRINDTCHLHTPEGSNEPA